MPGDPTPDALDHLVSIIASRDAQTGLDEIRASVLAQRGPERRVIQIRARTLEGTYESVEDGLQLIYAPRQNQLTIIEGHQAPVVTERIRFPLAAPVLAMFNPLDLPIWDAESTNYRVVDATRSGDDIRLVFSGPHGQGHAVVDLDSYVAMELSYLNWDYRVQDLVIQHPGLFPPE